MTTPPSNDLAALVWLLQWAMALLGLAILLGVAAEVFGSPSFRVLYPDGSASGLVRREDAKILQSVFGGRIRWVPFSSLRGQN